MRSLLLGVFLIFSAGAHAVSNVAVTQWTQTVLLNTLTVDSNYSSKDYEQHSRGFSRNAWNAISGFLGGYIPVIQDHKLSVHPTFLIEPHVVDSGIVDGIHYWRVNEEVAFPELNIKVAFSLLIIETQPTNNGPFLIQSMDMVKQEYP